MTAGSVRQVSAAQWLHTTAPLWRLPQEGGELAAMLQPATWIVLVRLPALRPCWSASAAWCRAARASDSELDHTFLARRRQVVRMRSVYSVFDLIST